ncbi:MAG: TonB-dependent receptor [Ignavibacteria bacterium]|nr:TonB-dependent receptor [Ignavibacteria bacterium]
MKSLIFTTLCIVFTVVIQARGVELVRGIVKDVEDNRAIPSANVAVVKRSDSTVVHGVHTLADGSFELRNVSAQDEILRISSAGYVTQFVQINSSANVKGTIDIGEILLKGASSEDVVVVGERNEIEYSANKKVLNVDKSMIAPGSNALDILKQVPSVNVDAEGNISVRGSSGVNIQIDGKPISTYGDATQVLRNLPATALQTVELTTNPGAKYDAAGQSGILNLVMKKQNANGVNGLVNATSGLLDLYSLSATGNSRQDDVNIFASAEVSSNRHNRYKRSDTRFANGTTIFRDGPSSYSGVGYGGRAGVDVTLSPQHAVTIAGDYRVYEGKNSDPFFNTITTPTQGEPLITHSALTQFGGGPYVSGGLTMNYVGKIDDLKKLTADVYVSPNSFNLPNSYLVYNTDALGNTVGNPTDGRRSSTVGSSMFIQTQAHYATVLSDETKIETGLRTTMQGIDSDFNFSRLDSNGAFQRDTNTSNSAQHQDNVYAAYVNLSTKLGDLSIETGLRGEHTTNHFVNTLNPNVNIERGFGNLFPSLSLSYKLSDATQLQSSYSKRINRPQATQINPFLDKSDLLNWRTGNPNLLPEYTHSMELGVLQYVGDIMISCEAFHRITTNLINLRFREQIENNVILEKPYNFGHGTTSGFSAFTNASVTDWLKMNGEVSYYHQQATGTFRDQTFNSTGYGWNGRVSFTAALPYGINAQMNYNYTAPQVIQQGLRMEYSVMSFVVNKSLLNDQLTLGLNWTDCLNTARFGGWVTGSDFTTDLLNKRDYTLLSLNVSYKINDFKNNRNRQAPTTAGPNTI